MSAEREAGPGSPLDDFGPLWVEAFLGMLWGCAWGRGLALQARVLEGTWQ